MGLKPQIRLKNVAYPQLQCYKCNFFEFGENRHFFMVILVQPILLGRRFKHFHLTKIALWPGKTVQKYRFYVMAEPAEPRLPFFFRLGSWVSTLYMGASHSSPKITYFKLVLIII